MRGRIALIHGNRVLAVRLPDELPYDEILAAAKPYLGPVASQRSDWTPLLRWSDPFVGFGRPRPADEDVWQFSTFLVHGPA
jgi:homospermidine synthase